jgi:ABC-type antimicrobial peptide transport system permease subunit
MTMLVILGIVIGAALVTTVIGQTRRSRRGKGPIELGVGRKLRQ